MLALAFDIVIPVSRGSPTPLRGTFFRSPFEPTDLGERPKARVSRKARPLLRKYGRRRGPLHMAASTLAGCLMISNGFTASTTQFRKVL